MKVKELVEDWKRIGACVTVGTVLVAAAIGAENHFAKASDQKALQQQVYKMQLSQNYNNFQMRIDSLRAPYVTYDQEGKAWIDYSKMPRETVEQIKWLEKQLKLLETEMGMTDGN